MPLWREVVSEGSWSEEGLENRVEKEIRNFCWRVASNFLCVGLSKYSAQQVVVTIIQRIVIGFSEDEMTLKVPTAACLD